MSINGSTYNTKMEYTGNSRKAIKIKELIMISYD
jgi:hypothetical protein